MNVEVNMQEDTLEFYVSKADETFRLDLTKVNNAGLVYLLYNGFKQSVQDAHAGATPDAAEKAETNVKELASQLCTKRVTRILDGTVGSGGGGSRRTPLEREVKIILAAKISGWSKLKASDKANKIACVVAGTDKDGNPSEAVVAIRDAAQARVDTTAELDLNLDL